MAMGVAFMGCGGDENAAADEAALAKVRVTPTSGLGTDEAGGEVSFVVELTTAPTEMVSIRVFSSDESEGLADLDELIFSPEDWSPKTVTVIGQADDDVDGNQRYQIVLDETVSNDVRYQSVPVADVTLTNLDDDAPGITFLHDEDFGASEDGGTAPLRVRLNSRPSAPVLVALGADPDGGTLDRASLTFLPRNWNVEQTVTMTATDDLVQDGDQMYWVGVQDVNSSDFEYLGLEAVPVQFLNVDDDSAGIDWQMLGNGNVTEGGDGMMLSFKLYSQPISDVVLRCESSMPLRVELGESRLVFTAEDWSQPHLLAVNAVDDAIDQFEDPNAQIACVAESEGIDYDGMTLPYPVDFWVYDDEQSQILVTQDGYYTCEGSESDCCFNVEVSLSNTASSDVALSITSDDPTEGMPSTSIVHLQQANEPATVQICGVDDAEADGYVGYNIVVAVASTDDSRFAELADQSIYIWNYDND
jgi:hypothetical protein